MDSRKTQAKEQISPNSSTFLSQLLYSYFTYVYLIRKHSSHFLLQYEYKR